MSDGLHTLTATDNAVSRGIWALIVKDFSGASYRDIEMAEKALRSDPMLLSSIISSVESLQKAYADDVQVVTAGVDTQTSGTVVMPVWHHERGWVGDESKRRLAAEMENVRTQAQLLKAGYKTMKDALDEYDSDFKEVCREGDESKNSLATVIAAFAKSIRTGGGRGKVTIVDGDIEDIDDETMVPTSITVLPEGYGAESDSELESADRAKQVAFIDAATGNRTIVDMDNIRQQDVTERNKTRRKLRGYDLIRWQETVSGDYEGVDSSETDACVIFVRKTKNDRYQILPGRAISRDFREHMGNFLRSQFEFNSFAEVRDIVNERAVAFFQRGGQSMSKLYMDINISINGKTKTLRGTALDAERLLKNMTLASQA